MSERQLAALLAREAIRDLPLRYCDCVWRDDVAGICDLFTADGAFIAVFNGKETTVAGRPALEAFYTKGLEMRPRPYIHIHVVELIDATSASGRCYLDLRSAKNDMGWLGAGYYEDRYALDDGQWRFKSRRFTALRMDEVPHGFE